MVCSSAMRWTHPRTMSRQRFHLRGYSRQKRVLNLSLQVLLVAFAALCMWPSWNATKTRWRVVVVRVARHGVRCKMIDWLTLRVARQHLAPATIAEIHSRMGRVTKTSSDGEIEWCIAARTNMRSDSHQVTVMLGADRLEITGSPARVMQRNNVFGSGNPVECWDWMVAQVEEVTGQSLPRDYRQYTCGRIDVTHNYLLESASEVRTALNCLRHAEGGRLQVRTESETVYWSPKSRHRSAKAYHKGPHLALQVRKDQAAADPWQIDVAQRLLRLELSLRSKFWQQQHRPWHQFKEHELDSIHNDFFSKVIGQHKVISMDTLLQQCERTAKTVGQGRAAYRTWCLIRQQGQESAKALMPRRTWLHHRKILFGAGLTFADLHSAQILPFRRRSILIDQPVRSWDDLREKVAA